MKKILKKWLCSVISFSITASCFVPCLGSTTTVSASNDGNQLIYENSCYITDTHIFDKDNNELYSISPDYSGDIKIKSTVQNATAKSGDVTAAIYSVSENREETEIKKSDAYSFNSLEKKDIEFLISSTEIPSDCERLSVRITVPDNVSGEKTYDAASIYTDVISPVTAPADSNDTTIGVHDPSIVKFPGDNTYYVYSSHHLIFTSDDLINWKKYDFTNKTVEQISPVTYNFITSNYTDTTVNGTYWAPDVIYSENDREHPYHMYISVSCGLGGRNSAISLMKSSSPLFWADENADIVDAGVVFATKESDDYKTNAIDAHIYTDKNGKQYFIWGSFWGGIQAASLNDDGFVEGIDYSSASSILTSCKNFGKTVYAQYKGIVGPEGPWMIEHGNYRYMFTSYGWLGTNYNTRIARSAISSDFSNVTDTATGEDTSLKDENNISMGTEYSAGSTTVPSGYKLIGSYRLGDGSYAINTVVPSDGNTYFNEYILKRNEGDANVYYGPGHNSAITLDNGETFYVSHTRVNAPNGTATLQIRKMLWTSDGWPVVSPVTYAGEKEQTIPKGMLPGTYDIASVGQMKIIDSPIKARNFDAPVLSSKITLNADGTLADDLGTWIYDNDHTLTITFSKDGDTAKDEFYKKGDKMTLFALFGYDKYKAEPVIALTGIDQNHITQFAVKSMSNSFKTDIQKYNETTIPISISKSNSGNPALGFDTSGNMLYAGDPAATVIGDTVYLIAGHDTATKESYKMPEWVLYTSKNMTDWTYIGPIMSATDISWRNDNTSAWASQMTEYNGKYYLYFCTWDKTSDGKQSIGVAVADKPEGPYKDALGKPLISGTFTMPETSGWNDIDPTVLIDTDAEGVEHRYLAWGNGKYYICELNEDMISVKDLDGDGSIVMHKDVKEKTIKSMNGGTFTEAPWLYKRNGKYYMFFAINWREEMAYAIADSPMGRYDYKQTIMPPTATSNTNHPSVIDFMGKTYFIYHNGSLPNGSGFRRSVCIEELKFDENGYVYPVTETSIGLTGTASTIKTSEGRYAGHIDFRNSLSDSSYPISAELTVSDTEDGYNTAWEIVDAKYVPQGENKEHYVSIESVNKPGLYISSTDTGLTLTQDVNNVMSEKMTFKTVKGLDGGDNSVSFESISNPGMYITASGDLLTLSYGSFPKYATFCIDAATQKDETKINIAPIEEDPEPNADISENFDNLGTGTLIWINSTDTPAYTEINGLTLYIGARGSGAETNSNFAISSGGVSGNALVLNSRRYVNDERAPRMKLTTPVIPNGYTVTATLDTKLGTTGSPVLRYNDSTSDYNATTIPGMTTSWQKLSISISNDDDTYTRTIKLGDNVIATDFIGELPVLWGTKDQNDVISSVYFDNLSIVTKYTAKALKVNTFNVSENGIASANITNNTNSDETLCILSAAYNEDYTLNAVAFKLGTAYSERTTEIATEELKSKGTYIKAFIWNANTLKPLSSVAEPVKLPAPTSTFEFEDNLSDTVSGSTGVLVNPKITEGNASSATPIFTEGYTGKAISFTGTDSYGINLGKVITEKKFSIEFKMKANEFTQFTSVIFINSGSKDNESWISAPIGYQADGNTMVWSKTNSEYIDMLSTQTLTNGKWHHIILTADGENGTLYIDGVKTASGKIADIISSDTNTYLGVNYWDTPFNGYIDNLNVYNGTVLTSEQVSLIYGN